MAEPYLARNMRLKLTAPAYEATVMPPCALRPPLVRSLALTLVLLVACGGNPLPEWKASPTPGPNAKRVDHLQKVTNSFAWHRSPYSRVDDAFDVPIYLIVADDGTGCIAPAADWTIAARGDFYPCPGKWRIAQP